MAYRAILFDLDDTLVDRVSALRRWVRDFTTRHDLPPGAREQIVELDDHGYRSREDFAAAVVGAFPSLHMTPAGFWDSFSSSLPSYVVQTPELHRVLDRLGERHTLGIVTNGSARTQRAKLDRAGLTDRFTGVFISGEVGAEKPDARIFARALAWAGCQPAEALFVGDDPVRDIQGARDAGLATAWVAHGRTFPDGQLPPSHTIQRVVDVANVTL